ncbi:MAG: sulfotransferase family protein [Salinivirgaceae bacterium]|nr:MAG: sulfotransferase family protein [Salinivirgaceae bacterium]
MIFYYTALFIGFFVLGLFLRLSRSVFHKLAEFTISLLDAILSNLDEDKKIKEVQKRTNKLMIALFKVVGAIIISLVLCSVPIVLYSIFTKTAYNDLDFSSFYPILVLSAGATVPFIIPLPKKNKSSYSELSQLIHRMALDNYNVANKLFKKEIKKIKKKQLNERQHFVIVSGLARAGTTSLMNDIAKVQGFTSLSYANMPFVMSPNIWRKFYNPKSGKLKERSHKDGIKIGYDSNEALEEFFFKAKAHDSFIQQDCLTEYEVSPETYNDYLNYQTIIKLDDQKLYLAKNNNFILRYKSLRAFNDDFLMVIMYREPLAHAASLFEKHKEYKELQTKDPFVMEYMNWLGHHEFGLNQKFFKFQDSPYENNYEKNSLNYWLKNWIYYYSYVIEIDHPNTILINYDDYCMSPEKVVGDVISKTPIEAKLPELKPFHNSRKINLDYNESLYEEAIRLFQKLNK